jgi:hypothetical protein
MNDQDKSHHGRTHHANLEHDIRQAVVLGQNVQEAVKRITLKALSGGGLDTEAMRSIAQQVGSGVQLGLERHGREAGAVLEKAYAGLDEAFATAAEATTLALKEAAGKTREFARNDLTRMMEELKTLEGLYIDQLRSTAKLGKEFTSEAAQRFAEHATRSGTAVGRQIEQSLKELAPLGSIAEAQFRQGMNTSLEAGALVARAAAGFLAGLAERMDPHSLHKSASGPVHKPQSGSAHKPSDKGG